MPLHGLAEASLFAALPLGPVMDLQVFLSLLPPQVHVCQPGWLVAQLPI
jgi:hypothetical protein